MLKNLKSLFVVEDPESKSAPKKTAPQKEDDAAAPPHAGAPVAPRPAAPTHNERAGRAEPSSPSTC